MESKISSINAMLFLQHIVDADAEMKRISESVVYQSVEILIMNDMKRCSDNKYQRDDKGIHDDMGIYESIESRETVQKMSGISESVTSTVERKQ